jgi:type IV pilus assembly protein PilB
MMNQEDSMSETNDENVTHNAGTAGTNEGEELLTLDQAVQLLGASRPTLYRWLAQGEIKGLKVGRQWRFRRAELMAYMERDPLAVASAPEEAVEAELAFFAGELSKIDATLPAGEEESQIDRLIRQIYTLAIASSASDIHLEPVRQGDRADYWLRLRIDGKLHEVRRLPMSLHEALNLHFKQQANLDLTERRMPQDGSIRVSYGGKDYILLVATLPTLYGEAITVRILLKELLLMTLDRIGITSDHPLRGWIRQPSGVILVVGPTGSGKTTTLYSCLNEIASPERKTFLIEAQADAAIPAATTVQVNERAGMTYAAALRAVFRHDPDVVYVSDLPEREAARAVPEYALTGHLVLAQMAASSAADAVQRLVAIGVEPFAVGMALIGVVAQRLPRKICANCKEPYTLEPSNPLFVQAQQWAAAGGYDLPDGVTLHRGRGCEQCRHTGYRGRMPLYETMPWNTTLLEALLGRASTQELTDIAVGEGMRTLFAEGIAKVVEGQTTLDEVFRVTMSVL